jgi:hypothetical protein
MADPLHRPLEKREFPVLAWSLEELNPQLDHGDAQVGEGGAATAAAACASAHAAPLQQGRRRTGSAEGEQPMLLVRDYERLMAQEVRAVRVRPSSAARLQHCSRRRPSAHPPCMPQPENAPARRWSSSGASWRP